MSEPRWAVVLLALVERIVPESRRTEVLGDLEEDFARQCRQRGKRAARRWLLRATASLASAWLRDRLRRGVRTRTLLVRDTQLAWRTLASRPLTAASTAVAIGAGLAACALAWSLVHVLLNRPVSATHGHAVRRLAGLDATGAVQTRFSVIEANHIESVLGGAASLATVGLEPAAIRTGEQRQQTLAEIVGPGFTDLLGMRVTMGRPLLDPDHRAGAEAVAVISDGLWRDLFGRASSALGAPLVVNGRVFTVVGVSQPGPPTSFFGAAVDIWLPLAQGDAFFPPGWRGAVDRRMLSVFVLPLAAPALASRLAAASTELARLVPDVRRTRTLTTLPGTAMVGTQRDTAVVLSQVLLALAALILLVASANAGGVLLATAVAARHAAAIHVAIGAGHRAAARRLLLEGGLIGLAAGAVSGAVYAWARHQVADVALLPTLAVRLQLPEPAVMAAALLPAGVAIGVAAAGGPAIWAARASGQYSLGGGRRATSDPGLSRARRALVGAQVAMSLVLLVGAGLFGRSLDRLTRVDLGVVRDGLVALDFDIEPFGPTDMPSDALALEAVRRVRALPGVAAAAMASRAPVDSSTPTATVAAGDGAGAPFETTLTAATAGYFETVGTPILRGRPFLEDDDADEAIVNESLARRAFPDGDALGRSLTLLDQQQTVRIIGIARDAKYRSITESGRPHIYVAATPAIGLALLVRTSGDSRQLLLDVQRVLDGVGPGLAGFFPRTASDHLAIQLLPARVAAVVASWLSVLALTLCGIGLYGMVAWFGELRRGEMAIRLALGATRSDVMRLVFGQAFATAGPGMAAGLALAFVGAAAARGLLFGLQPADVITPVAGVGVVTSVVALAAWWPARRAALTDPAETLRTS